MDIKGRHIVWSIETGLLKRVAKGRGNEEENNG
jgi:hypothetical protein